MHSYIGCLNIHGYIGFSMYINIGCLNTDYHIGCLNIHGYIGCYNIH